MAGDRPPAPDAGDSGNGDVPADMAFVPLDANQAEWMAAHSDDSKAILLRLLNAEIRRETLKRAIAEESHIELVIRRHTAKWRDRLLPKYRPDFDRAYIDQAGALEAQAHREMLPAFDRSEDPRMRHAAMGYRFRFGVQADGTHGRYGASDRLQVRRGRHPGGWRR